MKKKFLLSHFSSTFTTLKVKKEFRLDFFSPTISECLAAKQIESRVKASKWMDMKNEK